MSSLQCGRPQGAEFLDRMVSRPWVLKGMGKVTYQRCFQNDDCDKSSK